MDVKNELEQLIKTFGKNGGIIISPAHVIEPEVPMQNIDMFIEVCQKQSNK